MTNFAPNSNGLLAPLKQWLNDQTVREIAINRPEEIFIERKGHFTHHALPILTERWLQTLGQLLANENKRQFNTQSPLLNGQLLDGARIYAILPPVARYPMLTIRRQVKMTCGLEAYSQGEPRLSRMAHASTYAYKVSEQLKQTSQLLTLHQQKNWHHFIRLAITQSKNIVISGPTACGKTTFLNACLQEVPLHERIIILEDVRELQAPHANQVQLLTLEGCQVAISMQTLLRSALRLRPDRIIMGEIRGQEITDFISACLTGHRGSMASIHAGSTQQAQVRMTQLYRQDPAMAVLAEHDIQQLLHSAIDVIVQLMRRGNQYKITSVYYRDA